jgi:uncharacterized protein YqcC (DUF446 family)
MSSSRLSGIIDSSGALPNRFPLPLYSPTALKTTPFQGLLEVLQCLTTFPCKITDQYTSRKDPLQ